MIPKIIHIYINKEDQISEWLDDIKSKYSDYDIRIWKSSDIDFTNDFIQECKCSGKAGEIYLNYLYNFYLVNKYGGFCIKPHTYIPDLNSLLNNNYVFEINEFENIRCDFFGGMKFVSEYDKNNPLQYVIKSFDKIKFFNKNGTLNKFNFNQYVGNIFKQNSWEFDDNFDEDEKIINNVKFILNITEDNFYDSIYKPLASIVMPVYNAEKFLKECINSIINQTFNDFELLCIDDGSTDNSKSIIESFNDDRIVYIAKEHSGIVDTLNLGLKRTSGKYIIRQDADDIMFPNRIEYQTGFMEKHPEIDILSNGFRWFNNTPGDQKHAYSNPIGNVTLNMLIEKNHLSHPSSCFRKSSIMSLPFQYEQYYEHAEDYKLWLTAAAHGLKIYSDGKILIYYRSHPDSITSKNSESMWRSAKLASNAYKYKNHEDNELTCIIPFQNEGQEIERTVASIRGTAHNVNIMLINDCSTDGYDYEKVSNIYGCEYIKTENNLGVAGCREYAISLCKTEYFLLLDGHMRFYDNDWNKQLLYNLKNHPNAIVTGNTLVFSYDIETDLYKNELHFNYSTCRTRAAIVNDYEAGWIFTGKWTNNEMPGYENKNLIPISCCMGAVYASNKTWWAKIDGLKGLSKWGQDEPYMSIKTWLAGGEMLLMKNWCVGHLYRDMSAYLVPSEQKLCNRIFLINFFFRQENEINEHVNKLQKLVGVKKYKDALKEYNEHQLELNLLKKHFWEKIAIKDLEWFLTEINKPIKENKGN